MMMIMLVAMQCLTVDESKDEVMNEQKIASSQRSGGSKGLHLPARTVSSCFPNRYKSLLRWDPDKIALQDLFCAGYMLCEMVVREEETQVFT